MLTKNLNKILIVGDAGRGKTTLAAKLSEKARIPHFSTDDFIYEVKFTKKRNSEESIRMSKQVFENKKWIVEGTTRVLYEEGLGTADIIIHLKHKNILTQWWLLFKRYLSRDYETLLGVLGLMKHVFYKKYKIGYRKGVPTPSDIVLPHQAKVLTLYSFKEIDNFLASLQK